MKQIDEIKIIGNVGAGTMGRGTAMLFAMNGYRVLLWGRNKEKLDLAIKQIENDLLPFEEQDLLNGLTIQEVINNIQPTTNMEDLKETDFISESVAEDYGVKENIWQQIGNVISDDTILTTNTSSLSPTKLQKFLKKPERFVVAHFWNPVVLMPLVEVVPGEQTDKNVTKVTTDFLKKNGKHAVALEKESIGFVGNRLQNAVLRESFHLIEEGVATPESIDEIVEASLGIRWSIYGPIKSIDLGGLDVFYQMSAQMHPDLANNTTPSELLKLKSDEGNLGLKTGSGFYDWHNSQENEKTLNYRSNRLLELYKQQLDKERREQ